MKTIHVELTPEDVSLLTYMLGILAGAASRDGDTQVQVAAVRLVNLLHQDDPNWVTRHAPCDRKRGTDRPERAGPR